MAGASEKKDSDDSDDDSDDDSEESEDDKYEVEALLSAKNPGNDRARKAMLFEVKWVGVEETTWIPRANMDKQTQKLIPGAPFPPSFLLFPCSHTARVLCSIETPHGRRLAGVDREARTTDVEVTTA